MSKANFQGEKLVIRTKNTVQTEKLLKVHLFGEAECEVEKDARRNQSKGTIVAYDLLGVSEDEIVGWLAEFGVVAAKRFMKTKRNDDGSKELEKTPTVLLTFDRPVLSNRLELDYTIYEVRQYVPDPLICLKCGQFGHMQRGCEAPARCLNCGTENHTGPCTKKCINCKENSQDASLKNRVEQMEKKMDRVITLLDRLLQQQMKHTKRQSGWGQGSSRSRTK